MSSSFDYQDAFCRTVGWVTPRELETLRQCRVAIGGMGAAGGRHLETLVRLGVEHFHIADFDSFSIQNFNRQMGADMSNVGRPKTAVLEEIARRINPEAEIRVFDRGVTEDNLDAFLAGVDVYVDGLDFFVLGIRRQVFRRCRELGIAAVTAAPLGMGAATLCFLRDGMSFEEYFRLEGYSEEEQYLRFLIGLSPSLLQRHYLAYPAAVNLAERRGPSTPMAVNLCAGIACTQVLKIVLGRGKVLAAPWGLHFDAYRNRMKRTWRPGGNDNPLQKLAIALARRQLARQPGSS